MSTPETDSPPRLVRPYFLLAGVTEIPLSHYQGMKVGLPPICICCRRATDGPASGCAEALCFECYELVRTRGSSLRMNSEQRTNKAMNDTIYETLESAKQACKKYIEAEQALEDQFGITEEITDSCVRSIFIGQYWDETGRLKSFGFTNSDLTKP